VSKWERRGRGVMPLRVNWNAPPLQMSKPVDMEEFNKRVYAVRHDRWFKTEGYISWERLYHLEFGSNRLTIGKRGAERFTRYLDQIYAGELVMLMAIRLPCNNRIATVRPIKVLFLVPPPSQAPPQSRLTELSDYNWWSRCRSCGGRRFGHCVIAGKSWAACWDCIPPEMYGTIGGVRGPRLVELLIERGDFGDEHRDTARGNRGGAKTLLRGRPLSQRSSERTLRRRRAMLRMLQEQQAREGLEAAYGPQGGDARNGDAPHENSPVPAGEREHQG